MATKPVPPGSQKRKAPEGNQARSSLARKRQKTQAIRTIPSQSSDAALSATGELDVASFVKAREYEINALEKSMQNARHGLTTRAFQQVPRNMRRRTASHNVKKVPRRLRRRAEKEMKEDNTPTITSRRRTPSSKMRLRLETAKRIRVINSKHKSARARKKEAKQNAGETDPEAHVSTTRVPRIKKNRLADPPKATSRFKKRQINKTWLPTHLWHVKRARMTRPSEPLWRMAIPLSPTEKSYRSTHRASGGRGAIGWDMSYMATIGCEGVEPSLTAMLRAIGFGGDDIWGVKGKKWRKGVRSASGWVYARDNEKRLICPTTVIWAAVSQKSPVKLSKTADVGAVGHGEDAVMQDGDVGEHSENPKPAKRKLFLRVHPAAFQQLWTEVFKVAKLQRPPVLLEDLRFEIASIDVIGPGSTEALCAVLQPSSLSDVPMTCSAQTWTKMPGLTNPASLSLGAVIGFNVSDPRLTHPRKSMAIKTDESSNDELIDLMVEWPPDDEPLQAGIFSQKARGTASKCLGSQKAINRRKTLTLPGETPSPKETDPQIPVMLLASRPNSSASSTQGTWTVLVPWKCLDPIWRCLMYYPLSNGGTARFGGLDETRQVLFERNEPWFPGDFPGTEAGIAWERSESEKRYIDWKRKPPSRRVNYDALKLSSEAKGEHGRGWACDWESLLGLDVQKAESASNEDQPQPSSNISSVKNGPAIETDTIKSHDVIEAANENPTSSPSALTVATTRLIQIPPSKASILLNPSSAAYTTVPASLSLKTDLHLATVRLTLVTRGSPLPCARIYRLPSADSSTSSAALRSQWLALDPHHTHATTPTTPTAPPSAFVRRKKIKSKRRNLPASACSTYPDEHSDLEAITYRPPTMVPEAIAEMDKKRREVRGKRERFQALKLERRQAARTVERKGEGEGEGEGEALNQDQGREELMRELMTLSADKGEGEVGLECPGMGDLIGFVTAGGYNLGVGRGMGMGAVWVERLREGWRGGQEGDRAAAAAAAAMVPDDGKRLDRERRLCIVRNAGERVGRLGVWEVCT